MGWAARTNPRSLDGAPDGMAVLEARIARFCAFFATREDYECYLEGRGITDAERAYLEAHLPAHLAAVNLHDPA